MARTFRGTETNTAAGVDEGIWSQLEGTRETHERLWGAKTETTQSQNSGCFPRQEPNNYEGRNDFPAGNMPSKFALVGGVSRPDGQTIWTHSKGLSGCMSEGE